MSEVSHIPEHVGIILDGNRRWARQQGKPTLEGHSRGADVFEEIAQHAFDRGVKCISAFVFSSENWNRTDKEVGYLMKLVIRVAERSLNKFKDQDIKIVILGRRDGLRKDVLETIQRVESETSQGKRGMIALCFNYGGQNEIVDATKLILADGVLPTEVDEDLLRSMLYHPEVPDIDLLIRTSGERRLSGFMLYRAAYAELYFTDTYWPAFTVDDFDEALEDYARRDRRFGT